MADIVTLAREAGVNLRLTRLKPAVRAVLERDGVIERIGADMIHGNIHRAVQAEQAAAQNGARRQLEATRGHLRPIPAVRMGRK